MLYFHRNLSFTLYGLIKNEHFRSTEDFAELIKHKTIVRVVVVTFSFILLEFSYAFILDHIIQQELISRLRTFNLSTDKIFVNDKLADSNVFAKDLVDVRSIFNHRPFAVNYEVKAIIKKETINYV